MMKKIFIIVSILFASCEDDLKLCGCIVTFSDALPVQFWLSECETFNEKEVDGVFNRCFCQPFNSSDEITVQFRNTTGNSYALIAIDEDDVIQFESTFTEVSSGIYQTSFSTGNNDFTDGIIQFLIIDLSVATIMLGPSGWTDLAGWTTKTSTQFTLTDLVFQPGPTNSYINISTSLGDIINFTFDYSLAGTLNGTISIYFYLSDSSNNATSNQVRTQILTGASGTATVTLTATASGARLQIQVGITGGESSSGTVDPLIITIPTGLVLAVPDSSILAKSDCISINEDHDETILINYHNNRPFASINSAVGTPDPEFNLRIPAIFSESDERHPRESEDLTLSNNTSLQLMAEIKKQRPLKVKHMPNYMHLKTLLAVSFQTVTIDNYRWKLDEAYEKAPGNPKFPLKTALCWLTQRDYVLRNVL